MLSKRLYLLAAIVWVMFVCLGCHEHQEGTYVPKTNEISQASHLLTDGDQAATERGFIVEFQEVPLTKKSQQLKGMATFTRRSALVSHKRSLKEKRERFRRELSTRRPGGVIRHEFDTTLNGMSVRGVSREKLEQFVAQNFPGQIKQISPVVEMRAVLADSVPHLGVPEVWELNAAGTSCDPNSEDCLTGEGMTIAIIDSGVDYNHPDLGGCLGPDCKVIGGYDFVEDDDDPMDDYGHGTHVAATAAGNGVLMGVAPEAKILAYRSLGPQGQGGSDTVIAAIEACVDPNGDGDTSDHVDVANMSLGAMLDISPNDPTSTAVDNAVEAGVVMVVAAGNSGPAIGTVLSPAMAREALTVGASCLPHQIGVHPDCDQDIADFSSRGPTPIGQMKPDVIAPGVAICAAQSSLDILWQRNMDRSGEDSHCIDDTHITLRGTSMAAPHVAGVAALVRQAHPELTAKEIKRLIMHNSDPLDLGLHEQGHGLVNVMSAVQDSTVPPVLQTQLMSVLPIDDQAMLIYSAQHAGEGQLTLEKAIVLEDSFEDLLFNFVTESTHVPPSTSSLEIFLPENEAAIAEIYKLTFTDEQSGEQYTDYAATFRRPPNSLDGWPKTFQTSTSCTGFGGVSAGNLRNAQTQDVFIAFSGTVCYEDSYVYDFEGESEARLPQDVLQTKAPGIFYDLDGDGTNELIHENFTFDASLQMLQDEPWNIIAPTVVADVNGDGAVEIVRLTSFGGAQISSPFFPEEEYLSLDFLSPATAHTKGGIVAVGDLDNDGYKEIVTNTLDVLSFTGQGFVTKPYSIENPDDTELIRQPTISLADVDRNGWLDILQMVNIRRGEGEDSYYPEYQLRIYERGRLKYSIILDMKYSWMLSEIVTGDITGDEKLEVLISDESQILMLNHRAELLRSTEHTTFAGGNGGYYFYSGLYTYDVDGDGSLEILKTWDRVYVYNSELEVIESSFPLFDFGSALNKASYPFFTDLNADGTMDILASNIGGATSSGALTVFAWELSWPWAPTEHAWIANGYDAGYTSCYLCNSPVPVASTGDADGNGQIGFADLTALLSCWGFDTNNSNCYSSDMDADGTVGFADLTQLLALMGTSLPSQCSDGIDNDQDGATDYPTEPGCASAEDNDESNCGDATCEGGENRWACPLDCP